MNDDAAYVLVVDDDASVCWALEQAIQSEGHRVKAVADAYAALRSIQRERPDVVLTDVRMPGPSGLELLAELKQNYSTLPVIVMTAHGTMEIAIQAVQNGAFDYLPKPLDLDQLSAVLSRAIGDRSLAATTPAAPVEKAMSSIIGKTPAMQDAYRRIAAAAATDLGVLVTGPSGSGKELVARALHTYSQRRSGPFIAVNCGALPDNLVESELFGHVAGAFTDAKEDKVGRVEAADGGTLFLDEIGELPPIAQVKLLRFAEDLSFTPIGGEKERRVDVRIIAATNRDLDALAEGGSFRQDLAYRLKVVSIQLPPLQDRLDDIPDLVRHFLRRIASHLNRQLSLTDAAMNTCCAYTWPGNVRQLKHVIEEAAVLATGGVIDVDHLHIASADTPVAANSLSLGAAVQQMTSRLANQHPGHIYDRLIDLIEAPMIREVLARTAGNQLRAAELLGINRITLKKRMDQLGITKT